MLVSSMGDADASPAASGRACRSPSLRAPPFNGDAIVVLIRRASQFRSSANNCGVWEAVETPLGILIHGTVVFLWKASLSRISTVLRRSERINQALAGNPIQRRYVDADTRRHKLRASLAADRDLGKTLPQGLQQVLVGCVLAIVPGCTASHENGGRQDGGRKSELWVTENHFAMMPSPMTSTKGKLPSVCNRLQKTLASARWSPHSTHLPVVRTPALPILSWFGQYGLPRVGRAMGSAVDLSRNSEKSPHSCAQR